MSSYKAAGAFCFKSYMHRGKMQLVRASTFKKFVRARNQSDRINEHLLHCCQSVGHCCFMLRLIASIIFRRLKAGDYGIDDEVEIKSPREVTVERRKRSCIVVQVDKFLLSAPIVEDV